MVKYESIIVFKPNMEDEERNSLVEKFKGIINANGNVEEVDDWGQRKLAYEIQKLSEGHYYLITFEADPTVPKELERNYRITESVIRYNVIKRPAK